MKFAELKTSQPSIDENVPVILSVSDDTGTEAFLGFDTEVAKLTHVLASEAAQIVVRPIIINKDDQKAAVSVNRDMGQEKQRPKRETEESPRAKALPAQRLHSKEKEEDKAKGQKVTQERRDGNGVSLYNKFSTLDLLDD
ncbi:BnaA02g22040D [Brassica napus]|uniref:BnaA02g22040D protein n=2 Tax=Brassica TaxID=3705 RepID=A0A078GJ78_BRANA|nr:BnaA02g22040D [Brassica napus]VDC90124.1 unnamed protein product [Brassica rapa]